MEKHFESFSNNSRSDLLIRAHEALNLSPPLCLINEPVAASAVKGVNVSLKEYLMSFGNNIPTVPATFEMESPKVQQIYPGFNAAQVRTILFNLGIEPPARLPSSRSTWVCQYPNVKALMLGCLSVSISQFDRPNNKPRYQIVVERFATPLPQETATPVALTVDPS